MLSQVVNTPSVLALATVHPSSASRNREARLKRTIEPRPSTPSREKDLSRVGLDSFGVVTTVRSTGKVSEIAESVDVEVGNQGAVASKTSVVRDSGHTLCEAESVRTAVKG